MPQGRYLFVSDLHLDAARPAAVERFIAFLATEARHCDALYILGDLFESWIGDDDDEPVRARVCDALRELTRHGPPCRVQPGNRDFLLGPGFAARTGCTLLQDPALLQTGGKRIVVSHGDALCTEDSGYQRYRWLVRRPALRRGWLRLPLAARRGLAAGLRRRSRLHVQRLAPQMMDVTPEAVAALLREWQADLLIHGHTHRPGTHYLDVDGRACMRIVLGDWYDQGSVLVLHADGSHALRVPPAPATRAYMSGEADAPA